MTHTPVWGFTPVLGANGELGWAARLHAGAFVTAFPSAAREQRGATVPVEPSQTPWSPERFPFTLHRGTLLNGSEGRTASAQKRKRLNRIGATQLRFQTLSTDRRRGFTGRGFTWAGVIWPGIRDGARAGFLTRAAREESGQKTSGCPSAVGVTATLSGERRGGGARGRWAGASSGEGRVRGGAPGWDVGGLRDRGGASRGQAGAFRISGVKTRLIVGGQRVRAALQRGGQILVWDTAIRSAVPVGGVLALFGSSTLCIGGSNAVWAIWNANVNV